MYVCVCVPVFLSPYYYYYYSVLVYSAGMVNRMVQTITVTARERENLREIDLRLNEALAK